MASQDIECLFEQSNNIEVKRFWKELEAAIGREFSGETVLDLGCSFSALFVNLLENNSEKLMKYWGIEKLSEKEIEKSGAFSSKTFYIEYDTSIEEFIERDIAQKFSLIFLRNVLHYIAPKYDDKIIDFLNNHLLNEGIIYIEVIPHTCPINHGRKYPFDEGRYKRYLKAFSVVSSYEYGVTDKHQLKATLKFVE